MSRGLTVAFVCTPIRAGDLFALLSGEAAWDLILVVNEDGVLEVRT